MQKGHVSFFALKRHADERGESFSLPQDWLSLLDSASDFHITTIKPGCVRGNHYHKYGRELIVVLYHDKWSLYWDSGTETDVNRSDFEGAGALIICVNTLASHAIKNAGESDLVTMSLLNRPYDPQNPDAYPRLLT